MMVLSSYIRRFIAEDDGAVAVEYAAAAAIAAVTVTKLMNALSGGLLGLAGKAVGILSGLGS